MNNAHQNGLGDLVLELAAPSSWALSFLCGCVGHERCLAFYIVEDFLNALVHAFTIGSALDFRLKWRLVGIIDACKSGKLSGASPSVKALLIATFTDLDRCIDIHLRETRNLATDLIARRAVGGNC